MNHSFSTRPTISRRGLLAVTGGALMTTGLAQAMAPTAASAATSTSVPVGGMHVVTLGTAGGPAIRGPRTGICTAVVVDGNIYLVDCGLGMVRQAVNAGLTMDRLRGVFLTHLHSDHISELPGLLLYNWGPAVRGLTEPFPVFGPAPSRLPREAKTEVGPGRGGTRRLVDDLLDAYSYDVNIRVYDEARPPLDELVDGRNIDLPRGVHADPDRSICPEMEPFEIYADEHVRVLATLVNHPPVFPAFGFRFESEYGSVVVSGDTTEHANVMRLAEAADILVHEAIDINYYLDRGLPPDYVSHLAESHTDLEGVGRVAAGAQVGRLVLTHLGGIFSNADADPTREIFADAVVADDGQVFSVGS